MARARSRLATSFRSTSVLGLLGLELRRKARLNEGFRAWGSGLFKARLNEGFGLEGAGFWGCAYSLRFRGSGLKAFRAGGLSLGFRVRKKAR